MQLEALPATPEKVEAGPVGPLPYGTSARLPQIDVLRALACLWVVFFHGYGRFVLQPHPILGWISDRGYLGVNLFMVLSGFCLARPIILKGGWSKGTPPYRPFLKRRALRILPPYFGAFFLFVALGWLRDAYPHLPVINSYKDSSPTVGGFISHLLMAHNLSPAWVNQVNGVFWSLALEFQFYAVFVLLALWFARFGLLRMLLFTFALSLIWESLCAWRYGTAHIGFELSVTRFQALPASLAAFVAGMCVAQLVSEGAWDVRINRWIWISVALLAAAYSMVAPRQWVGQNVADAIAFGVLTLAFASMPARFFQKSPVLACLEFIGIFSYSIYLLHRPLISVLGAAIWTPTRSVIAVQILLMPAILLFSYGFFLLLEKPFLRAGTKRRIASELASAV